MAPMVRPLSPQDQALQLLTHFLPSSLVPQFCSQEETNSSVVLGDSLGGLRGIAQRGRLKELRDRVNGSFAERVLIMLFGTKRTDCIHAARGTSGGAQAALLWTEEM